MLSKLLLQVNKIFYNSLQDLLQLCMVTKAVGATAPTALVTMQGEGVTQGGQWEGLRLAQQGEPEGVDVESTV